MVEVAGQNLEFKSEFSERTAAILGGPKLLKASVSNAIEAHEMLLRGIPVRALSHLIDQIEDLDDPNISQTALGVSVRTLQRMKTRRDQQLNQQQSARAWTFAYVLARAADVFGSREEAVRWLDRPAIGLDRRRPIDLISTPAGVELVEVYLRRIDAGVYA